MESIMNRAQRCAFIRMNLQHFAEKKTLKGLTEQRAELATQIKAILDSVKEEQRTMTEEEGTSFTDLEAKIKAIDATLDAEKRALNLNLKTTSNELHEEASKDQVVAEERAFAAYIRNNVEEIRTGEIQLTQGSNGSIVPTTIANRIITAVRDTVPFLTMADVVYTNGKLSIPVYGEDATNYINAGYVSEGSEVTDNIGKFTTVDLTGYVIGALSLISNKLLNNNDFDLTSFVVEQIARAMSEMLEKEFINGTSNKITGIISATSGITAASATAVTYDELLGLKHSIKQRFRNKCVWIMAPATYTAICKLKDSNGQPYFKENDYNILGNKVIESDSMPAMTTGNEAIVFADLSGYTIKATKSYEITILREKYSTKNMIGVLAFGEYDAKISDAKKIRVLTMA